jgi:cytochrome P450
MKRYHELLNKGIAHGVGRWLPGRAAGSTSDLRFYPAVRQLTLDLAATAFLGVPLGPEANAINRTFVEMLTAASGLVRVPIPGSTMWKGVRGRARLGQLIGREIPKRRQSQDGSLFSELCRATKEDGALLTDQEIIDHMSFLLLAAHDTATSTSTTLVNQLARHPDWQQRLREEFLSLDLPAGALLPYERLDELPLLEMAYKETLRLAPPVPMLPRKAVRDFEFMGHRIPAGTMVAVSPLFTHLMPDLWPEPERFDPLRFTDEAVRARHKYAWVPYGGGAHMCIGLHFSYMLIKTLFYHLLTNARVSVAPGYAPRWQVFPYSKPLDGLNVTFERIAPSRTSAGTIAAGTAKRASRCPMHQAGGAPVKASGCPVGGDASAGTRARVNCAVYP